VPIVLLRDGTACRAIEPDPLKTGEEDDLTITIYDFCHLGAESVRITFKPVNTDAPVPHSSGNLEDKFKTKGELTTAELKLKLNKFDRTKYPIPTDSGAWEFDYRVEVVIGGAAKEIVDPRLEIDPYI
jgi:hypothetical protein